jgi:hypothetical protein
MLPPYSGSKKKAAEKTRMKKAESEASKLPPSYFAIFQA